MHSSSLKIPSVAALLLLPMILLKLQQFLRIATLLTLEITAFLRNAIATRILGNNCIVPRKRTANTTDKTSMMMLMSVNAVQSITVVKLQHVVTILR